MPALPWTSRTTPDLDATYVVMGSKLPLRGYRFIPRFMAHSLKIRRQLAGANGLVGYALNARLTRKEFWTVSVWESKDDLERFAAANPHATIIKTKTERMGESRFVFWACQGGDVPITWDTVAEHLTAPVAGGE
jgi:heme-degrading monooxygenase HmoA